MNTRILFGYLFFALSVVLATIQFIKFPQAASFESGQLPLLSITTVVSLMLSFLAIEARTPRSTSVLSFVSFGVAFSALVACAGFAFLNSASMSAVKYTLMLLYAAFYVGLGLAFSLISHKPNATSGDQGA